MNLKKQTGTIGKLNYFGYPDHGAVQFDVKNDSFMMIKFDPAGSQYQFKYFCSDGRKFRQANSHDRLSQREIKNYVTFYATN